MLQRQPSSVNQLMRATMAIDEELALAMRQEIGVQHVETLGVITKQLIGRYAAAVNDLNPLYLDEAHAKSCGFNNVVAPPNLLTAVITWSYGAPYDRLRDDGTEAETHLPGVPDRGVRVMGGGEESEFVRPVVAGTYVRRLTALMDVTMRQSRSGPMLVLGYEDTYTDQDDQELVRTRRTVLLR